MTVQSSMALRIRGCARWGLSWDSSGCCQVAFEASGVNDLTRDTLVGSGF